MQVQGPHKHSQTLIGLIQPYLTIIPPPPHLDIILQINMIWTIYFDNFNILDVYDLFIVFEMYSPFCTWPSNWLKITEICPNKNSRKRKKQDSVAQDPKKSHWEAFSSLCSSVEKTTLHFLILLFRTDSLLAQSLEECQKDDRITWWKFKKILCHWWLAKISQCCFLLLF